jgi:RepB DNA-primase from phage plasmid/CHC2 zinc finger
MSSPRGPDQDLRTFLDALTQDARPDRFLELRWPAADGMRRRFFQARATPVAAWHIGQLAPACDVYLGIALRDRNTAGGKDAISGSHFLHLESDSLDCAQRLEGFAHPPTIEIASGTPGHLQLYWRLIELASNDQVESANRRLAIQLDGDPASVDIARILRPPDTLNHKHEPPRPVRLLAHRPEARYLLSELTEGLPDDPRASPPRIVRLTPRVGRTALDRELLAIPAAEYVGVLASATPNRAGKIACPFHDDSDPSLQLYPDGTFNCFGSGCRRGGTIFDFAAARWGLGTRGRDFLELRRRLALMFGLSGSDRST